MMDNVRDTARWAYDQAADAWEDVSDIPQRVSYHAKRVARDAANRGYDTARWAYDQASDAWEDAEWPTQAVRTAARTVSSIPVVSDV
jgi:hypothetical protein